MSARWWVLAGSLVLLTAVGAGVGAETGALAAPPADAADAVDASVNFTGSCGVLGVGASSQPDTVALTVSAGSDVELVNHLGIDATVLVDGNSLGEVPAEQNTALTLTGRGVAMVQMRPACLLQLPPDSGVLTITVTLAAMPSGQPTGTSAPTPAPTVRLTDPPVPTFAPGPPPQAAPPAQSAPPLQAPARSTPPTSRAAPPPAPIGGAGQAPPTGAIAGGLPTMSYSAAPPPGDRSGALVDAAGLPVGPVRPLGEGRPVRYTLTLVALVLIVGTGLAALRLLTGGRHVGVHRIPQG